MEKKKKGKPLIEQSTKPDIVVDIDEVLADSLHAMLKWYNQKYHTNFEWKKCYTYKLWNVFNTSKEENALRFNKFFEECNLETIRPVEGSQEGIDRIHKIANIHVVTGRNDGQIEYTKSWLKKHFHEKFSSIEFTSHYYTEKPVKKSEVCKRLNAKIIIEDDLEHAIDCANHGVKVILLNRPWNQTAENKDIIRVDSWEEIVKTIGKLLKK